MKEKPHGNNYCKRSYYLHMHCVIIGKVFTQKKEKMLQTSIFSFSHNVSKSLLCPSFQNSELCSMDLIKNFLISIFSKFEEAALRDIDRFKRQKAKDLKEIFTNYAIMQIKECKKVSCSAGPFFYQNVIVLS